MKAGMVKQGCPAIAIALCVLACFKIVIQDLPRMRSCLYKLNDIQPLYLSSRVWLEGKNPYDVRNLVPEMMGSNRRGMQELHGVCEEDCNVYYPPTALPIFSILSWLPWPIFLTAYLGACIGLYCACLWSLSKWLVSPTLRFLFISLGVAFSPLHSGLGTFNVSELLIPILLICALWQDSVLAAFVMGLITCIKPPLGMLFLIYYSIDRRYRQTMAYVVGLGTVAAVSLIRLQGTPWLPAYKASLAHFAPTTDGPGGVASHGMANAGFLNLEALFYIVTGRPQTAVLLNYLVLLCMFAGFAVIVQQRSGKPHAEWQLNAVALLCCLTLFQSTLQYYNGLLLLMPALYALRTRSQSATWLVGLPAFSFVLPPKWFLFLQTLRTHSLSAVRTATQGGRMKSPVQSSGTQELVAVFPSLLVVWIALVLLFTMLRMRTENSDEKEGIRPYPPLEPFASQKVITE